MYYFFFFGKTLKTKKKKKWTRGLQPNINRRSNRTKNINSAKAAQFMEMKNLAPLVP